MLLLLFADLLTSKTLENWKTSIVATATAVGLKTQNWIDGGYTRTLVALFSQLFSTAGDVVRVIAASGFLDTAEGDWLTLLVKNVFNVDRNVATYAAAPNGLALTNTGGGLFVFEVGDLIVAHSSTHRTYVNTSEGTLAPGIGQTLTLDIRAEEAGSDSNASVGSITSMVATFLGVTCSNGVALVGLDQEKDAALRVRARNSIAFLAGGGIKRGYEYAAQSAKDSSGTSLGVTRVRVMPAPGDASVTVYIAGASGAVSIEVIDAVQAVFDNTVTPYGFFATALSATNHEITAACTIWIPASLGMTEADARLAVFDALEAYVETLPIGGVVISPAAGAVYWRALLGVVVGAIPGTLKGQLTVEADIAITDGEVPVWAGLLADTTVIQVSS